MHLHCPGMCNLLAGEDDVALGKWHPIQVNVFNAHLSNTGRERLIRTRLIRSST